MYILGISCFYHESAVCLIKDGAVVAASAEERFTRIKHDSAFPKNAVDFCLSQAYIKAGDLDYVVFYEKPFLKFHRILMSAFSSYPFSSRLFAKSMATWLSEKLWVRSNLASQLKINRQKILFVPHHLSHAAASFYPSGFKKAAILTFDGVGEWTTTTYGSGEREKITLKKEIKFPHSLGLLYSVFTAFLGFKVNDGEYKVMGMAPYGKPTFLKQVKKLIKIYKDGSYKLNMEYFSFHTSVDKSFSKKFVELFGFPRDPNLHFFTKNTGFPSYFGQKPKNWVKLCELNQQYADIAASIQALTEELLLVSAQKIYEQTKLENLCIGGGVALNSVANGLLLTKGPFKNIFIQPASGDDGGAMGAAFYVYHNILQQKRNYIQTNCYFGCHFKNSEIEKILKKRKIKYKKVLSEKKLIEFITSYLIKNKVVAFFHGRAEWGPRALGSRSILASPMSPDMKDIINIKIKFREPYRPFAPVVLSQKVAEYFQVESLQYQSLTDFMLGVFRVKKDKVKLIPAVTHIDGSARVQTIKRTENKRYYDLIKGFGDKTGVYVLLNTSFNLKGEPIVNSPEDALRTFFASGLDLLVLENYLVLKEDNPKYT